MAEQIQAPWSDEQVRSLNEYQESGFFHPFTCRCRGNLVAQQDGWICPNGCEWSQTWCWDWMANWDWKKSQAEEQALIARLPENLRRLAYGERASEAERDDL